MAILSDTAGPAAKVIVKPSTIKRHIAINSLLFIELNQAERFMTICLKFYL
jgi:hypothetical protein